MPNVRRKSFVENLNNLAPNRDEISACAVDLPLPLNTSS